MAQGLGQGFNDIASGDAGIAKATGDQGKADAAVLQKAAQTQQQQQQTYQSRIADLDTSRKMFQDHIANNPIDANHYINNMSTGNKIGTALGLVLAGFGSGMAGQANPVMSFLNQQIDRDIQAQKDNLGSVHTLLSENMKQYGNERDAMDMTRIQMNDMVNNKLKMDAAKAAGPLAASAAAKFIGEREMQLAPQMSNIAMRRTLVAGMTNGRVPPENIIRMMVPEPEQAKAYEELDKAKSAVNLRDNALGSFDNVANFNTLGQRVTSPFQTLSKMNAARDNLVATLSKDTAGRFTPQDAETITKIWPTLTDDAKTVAFKRQQLHNLVSQKMEYSMLSTYLGGQHGYEGLPSRYDVNGQPKFKLTK
jgi:hypothetical protein